jgi:PAS domain S-box-containing protein
MATDRVTRGLAWLGTALLLSGAAVTVGAIALTTSIEALVAAASVAALALALPGAAAFGIALWLEHAAERAEQRAIAAMQPPPAPEATWGETLRRYALAIVAVLFAWGARAWLDLYIPDEVPFITFFLAVAFAGWMGGFGPSAAATLLSTAIAGVLYVRPASDWDLGRIMLLAIFLVVCLGIAAIVSALHDALARAQQVTGVRRDETPRDSDNPLRALAQFAPAALFMTDATQGCTYCNRAWLAFRGRALQQELGNGWCEGVHAEDLARRREAFAEALATREPRSVTYRLKHADGGFRPVRDVVVAHVNARGQLVGLFGACAELAVERPTPDHGAKAFPDSDALTSAAVRGSGSRTSAA